MTTEITDLYPKQLWQRFYDICQVPHPSEKEQKIIKFVKEFGENLRLETIVDEVGNVIIRKPAFPGMEDKKGVVLQAHLDMVPQKDANIQHDFEKDPIEAYVDGDWVKAKGTTLGADDGIGVAAILAVLEAKDIEHGPIEALFTVGEEYELIGATSLKSDFLKNRILLNLDSEKEGEFCIGSGGALYSLGKLHYQKVPLKEDIVTLKVHINGLRGGHSAEAIHLGRGNANKILSWILWKANRDCSIRVSTINGGELPNSIPVEASAIILLPKQFIRKFEDFIKQFIIEIKKEFAKTDPDLEIEITPEKLPDFLLDEKSQDNLLNFLFTCPNGTFKMSDSILGIPETSTNLAKVTQGNDLIEILTRQRSSVNFQLERLVDMACCNFKLANIEVVNYAPFPVWEINTNSFILKLCRKLYLNKFKSEAIVTATHGALECGMLTKTFPDMDIISLGATIEGAHSINEKVNISSVGKFWDFLVEVLKNIPQK